MPITMQGSWTVSVKSKSAAWPQRFVITGSDAADGDYVGDTTTAPVFVTGAQWSISVEHNPTGPAGWLPSSERITFPVASGGLVRFDIQSNDTGGDVDYNDLILTCSMPENPFEYVVYGNVKTYKGLCFNPCFPRPWLVVETELQLLNALRYPALRRVLQEVYPERVREADKEGRVIRPPRPEPDPVPFRPMLIPLGSVSSESHQFSVPLTEQASQRNVARFTTFSSAAQTARLDIGSAVVSRIAPYALEVAKIKDLVATIGCTVAPQPGLLLRFLEYDRTTAELAGGPYTGDGNRVVLGLAVTDEQGNYIFRFTQTLAEVAEEAEDIVSGGPPLATQLRPDLIVQAISGGTAGVLYESGLYADVPNLRRIDICVPFSVLNPGPTACQGGRAIQSIGNIWTISGVGNSLDGDGRITATNPTGPIITNGAWVGRLDLFACFLDAANPVAYYTIRFRRPGGGWAFVQELYTHIKIADIGTPNYTGTKVGPDNRNLAVDGGPKIIVPSYENIESDPAWVITHRLRKIQLSSSYYENILYGPNENPRTVVLKIEGYSSSGDKVLGAEDTIELLIDNRPVTGDLDGVSMGAVSPGECALFALPSANEPLTVRFKVVQPGGFVKNYELDVRRGSNTPVPVSAPLQPLSLSYDPLVHGNNFRGTFNAVAPDANEYVEAVLTANSGSWLPAGENFCSFMFRISGTPRTTNGYSLGAGHTLDLELVGISFP